MLLVKTKSPISGNRKDQVKADKQAKCQAQRDNDSRGEQRVKWMEATAYQGQPISSQQS